MDYDEEKYHVEHANMLNNRFRILDLIRYCRNSDINYNLELAWLRGEFYRILKIYDDDNILDFSHVEKILKNVNVEEKYKQHIKRKIKLLTIKNNNL